MEGGGGGGGIRNGFRNRGGGEGTGKVIIVSVFYVLKIDLYRI